MYNDYTNPNRETWKFDYKGAELLEYAKKCYQSFLTKEIATRRQLKISFSDVSSRREDRIKLEENCNQFGRQRELCGVYVHEFGRNLDRVYHLSVSDVVYFGIVPDPDVTI